MTVDVLCLRPEADFRRVGVTPPASLAIAYRAPDDPQLAALVRQARALVIPAVGPKLDGSLFEGSGVKLVQVTGAGVDRLDEAAMRRLGIPVANVAGGSNSAVGEYAVGCALFLLRRLAWADAEIRAGNYVSFRGRMLADNLPGLEGLAVGVIGMGTIGLAVAGAFHRFGCRIAYHDPAPRDLGAAAALGAQALPLDELLGISDIVTLHVPLTPRTRNLIGARELALMKPDAVLINAARGGIVDETALYNALKEGAIAGAALDVFAEEPTTDSPLFSLPNVVVTPHLGASTEEAQTRVAVAIAQQVADLLLRGLQPLAEMLGLVLTPGTVVDFLLQPRTGPPVFAVGAAGNYGRHPITDGFRLNTLFPHARQIGAGGLGPLDVANPERNSRRVDGDFRQPGNCSEILRLQDSHGAKRKHDSESGANEPECEAFNEQLSRNPRPTSAKRRANSELLRSRLRPHQDQVCYVGTDEQEYQTERSHQDTEHGAHVTLRERVVNRFHERCVVGHDDLLRSGAERRESRSGKTCAGLCLTRSPTSRKWRSAICATAGCLWTKILRAPSERSVALLGPQCSLKAVRRCLRTRCRARPELCRRSETPQPHRRRRVRGAFSPGQPERVRLGQDPGCNPLALKRWRRRRTSAPLVPRQFSSSARARS